ncbi:MAG: hypothetical protein LBQ76_08305, partial [Candidatus Fibromonas sp.]|nr:hypothetical protein [Candidatus Fibromonas sp.]
MQNRHLIDEVILFGSYARGSATDMIYPTGLETNRKIALDTGKMCLNHDGHRHPLTKPQNISTLCYDMINIGKNTANPPPPPPPPTLPHAESEGPAAPVCPDE